MVTTSTNQWVLSFFEPGEATLGLELELELNLSEKEAVCSQHTSLLLFKFLRSSILLLLYFVQ